MAAATMCNHSKSTTQTEHASPPTTIPTCTTCPHSYYNVCGGEGGFKTMPLQDLAGNVYGTIYLFKTYTGK